MTDPRTEIYLNEPSYPVIVGFAQHASTIAWTAAGGALIILLTAWYPAFGLREIFVSVVCSAFIYLLARFVGDIARLLVDTLVPR
jgi:hypothetical protein